MLYSKAQDEFEEEFDEVLDDDGCLVDSPPENWKGQIHGLATRLTPNHREAVVDEWVTAGYPTVADETLITGFTDPLQIMRVALFEEYQTMLFDIAKEAGFPHAA